MSFVMKSKDIFAKIWRWVRTDGLLHILVCMVMVYTLGGFPWMPIWAAAMVGAVGGLGYEVAQLVTKKGTAEWHDVFCDLIGVGLSTLVLCIQSLCI